MDGNRNEITGIVRNTPEYQEARAILVQKAKLRAELARMNAELKQFRRLSPEAVELAKTDTESGLADS